MKSGLEDRNNEVVGAILGINCIVSMKSGLEDRNNGSAMVLEMAQA